MTDLDERAEAERLLSVVHETCMFAPLEGHADAVWSCTCPNCGITAYLCSEHALFLSRLNWFYCGDADEERCPYKARPTGFIWKELWS